MKYLFAALLLVSFASSSAHADSPEAILKDYRKQAAQAVERLNQSLEKAATPLITKLVSSGDTAEADELTSQLKVKLAGEPVPLPQASAKLLFAQYDQARTKALEPVQKSTIARIDSLLKAAGGPKLETITELSKARAEVEEGKVSIAAGTPAKPDYRDYFKQYKISKSWGYYLNADFTNKNGMLYLKEDGTLLIDSGNSSTGTWMPTSDPMVLAVDLKTEKTASEKTQMIIKGKEATINRPSGLRYLKPEK